MPNRDYNFIEDYRKAYTLEQGLDKRNYFVLLKDAEARHDYDTGLMMDIKHLIQLDPTPRRDLTEAKWEIYKISISFGFHGKNFFRRLKNVGIIK